MANKNKDINKFTKKQLLSAKKYINNKDILKVILDDKRTYSFAEVDKILKKTLERGVR